jgi:hypothetical protein
MRSRTLCVAALVLALTVLTVWRAVCVLSGPDIDTDAYAHHMIARAILADPRDLAVHWVWLPLFHYLQVPLVALGGTMDDVRWANVFAATALPVVLFGYVRRTAEPGPGAVRSSPDLTALLAALFAAACPIVMQMGTTAQPESLFALATLGTAIAFQERKYVAASAMLSAGVLLRYEAWASLLALAGFAGGVEPWWRRRHGLVREERASRLWAALAVPLGLIVVWAVLRRPVDGRWFGFLGSTRAFASDATHESSSLDRGAIGVARDLAHYPLFVPARVLGAAIVLVPFGIARTVRQQGARFVIVQAACLGFISLAWVMRSTLGLDRHFVAVVPLYSTLAAQGAATVGDWARRLAGRFAAPRVATLAGSAVLATVSVVSLVVLGVALDQWMAFWRGSLERGWPDRSAMGAYLRSLPPSTTIFCDEATVEILSGLDRHRFDRHWIDDPHTWELVEDVARERGVAYVATWDRKLRGHNAAGSVVFRARPSSAGPDSELAVMRVRSDAGRAGR